MSSSESRSAIWGEFLRVLFAHGFEGSATGTKPTYMREALGWDVTAPLMSELGWSIESQTEVLLRHIDSGEFDLIAGSSMGGLAAANASSLRKDADFRLFLIAPAFGLAEHWDGMEESGRRAWQLTDQRRYKGFELDIVLPWEFMEAADRMSWPVPAHFTSIMHGKYDEIVPISCSRKVAEKNDLVELYEVDDNHRMKETLGLIPEVVERLMAR
ncbi:MAG: YqiA/YcfP family alpha/beta fold hydrolase [Candidatus Thermoplasmatota archaeon]|nr:YqiA/YcfP family alpha/beta fold hydrolase [Candidatus Thermoplasmatota archaeon]